MRKTSAFWGPTCTREKKHMGGGQVQQPHPSALPALCCPRNQVNFLKNPRFLADRGGKDKGEPCPFWFLGRWWQLHRPHDNLLKIYCRFGWPLSGADPAYDCLAESFDMSWTTVLLGGHPAFQFQCFDPQVHTRRGAVSELRDRRALPDPGTFGFPLGHVRRHVLTR